MCFAGADCSREPRLEPTPTGYNQQWLEPHGPHRCESHSAPPPGGCLQACSDPLARGSFKHAVVLLGIARSGTSYQREPSYTCGLSPNLEAMAIDENHAHRAQAQHQHNSCIPANLDPTPWPSLLDGPGRIEKLRPSPQRIIASVTLVQPQASCPDIIYVAGCQTPVFRHFPPPHSQP